MTLQIRRTGSKDYGRYIKALICGDPGAGKTLISSTFPNPLYASAEGGLMSIADRNIPYAEIRSMDDLLRIKNALDQSPDVRQQLLGFPVDTLVVDTIDEIQRILIRERLEEQKKEALQLQDWGWLGEQMQAIIRGLRNLEMNVVLTCHLKETTDSESGKLYFKPQMQGAIGDQLPAFVDLALLLRASMVPKVINGEAKRVMVRVLQTYPDPQHPWIKDRSGKLDQEIIVDFENDYKRIAEALFSNIDDLSDPVPVDLAAITPAPADDLGLPPLPTEPVPKPNGPALPAARAAKQAAPPQQTPASSEEVKPPVSQVTPVEDLQMIVAEETPLPANGEQETPGVPDDPNTTLATEAPVAAKAIECQSCKGAVESQDQADLSRIRFRKVLCRTCFTAQKRK